MKLKKEVLNYSALRNLVLNYLTSNPTHKVEVFNFVASLGLGICVGVAPLLNNPDNPAPAIAVLCLANFFAGQSKNFEAGLCKKKSMTRRKNIND